MRLLPLRPVGADHTGHLGAVPVPADHQPVDLASAAASPSGRIADGSSSRISSANESARPLCGVAEARISASELRGQQPGQPVVLGRRVGQVVRLVDDHGVPALLAAGRDVAVGLQRVDRDDRPAGSR